ncbi:hydantoinase/oxoprolinase family protein [Hansschlegelia quercus]|uniref:Hydantoinase/oxoprolinase family protein n=1 Tax=Hansschlegelia quercus TaxID=2528245 RepID=A0A4V2JEG8_9HYPH|nr:hydantoinase/oxoprolinase family protein [Hansschlegelia quercus]TBN55216.1 hydantoinase/oxoprolinase family protein [Hansschlegelia quercus]
MRLSIDVGGTFTDLVVDRSTGAAEIFKAPTTYPDPIDGILAAVALAAEAQGADVESFLGDVEVLFHSTTRAINAVITGQAARTALLATEGHPDILLIREGGRTDPFNYRISYPAPYIPRALTFEIPGRILADGGEHATLDEAAVLSVIESLKAKKVEAVAVSLLWSIVNPAHELRVGELLAEHLPDVPFTLAHQLNPTVREYRRTSSCAIDASLKPIMSAYLRALKQRLGARGLKGQIFAVTSQGGLVDVEELAERPILALNSGPSMAPVAGRYFAKLQGVSTAIVTDAGGTTYDVSLVRGGALPRTRETWLGPVYQGHLTGFPSVDVKSVGAGGGSIASVEGGLLRVGPESARSDPGPVCYGRGGTRPTVTDAAVVLGYIDPNFFLGGQMGLAVEAARAAIESDVAIPLGLGVEDAALAIVDLATESMVHAIEDITVKQGVDPEDAVIIGGGGAAGINAVLIARRLGCRSILFPDVGAALSAAGAMMSELTSEFSQVVFMKTGAFDAAGAQGIVAGLKKRAETFFASAGGRARDRRIDLAIEGRYPSQVWEIDVAIDETMLAAEDAAQLLVAAFHARHEELFGFRDDGDDVEIMGWTALARCRLADESAIRLPSSSGAAGGQSRSMAFRETGRIDAPAYRLEALDVAAIVTGPAVVESNFTTVVLAPGSRASKTAEGGLIVEPFVQSVVRLREFAA